MEQIALTAGTVQWPTLQSQLGNSNADSSLLVLTVSWSLCKEPLLPEKGLTLTPTRPAMLNQ